MTATPAPSRLFRGLPPYGRGERIGLFGGTFNPAHPGHRVASLLALNRLKLDRIWWLVTPGNPLKEAAGVPSLDRRMRKAAEMAAHPRIVISGVEETFRTRYTADLIRILRERVPGIRFVWIMGSDNLAQFHRWENWRRIAAEVPIAVVNRPGSLSAALSAPAAQALRRYRVDEQDAGTLAERSPPAWVFLTGPRSPASSTALRGRGCVLKL
ncbi:MAG TPA: nicotinate-nucleotide adenylyltransferase [Propylenella sp.]